MYNSLSTTFDTFPIRKGDKGTRITVNSSWLSAYLKAAGMHMRDLKDHIKTAEIYKAAQNNGAIISATTF